MNRSLHAKLLRSVASTSVGREAAQSRVSPRHHASEEDQVKINHDPITPIVCLHCEGNGGCDVCGDETSLDVELDALDDIKLYA
jgi:hypothetical protein